MPYVERVTKAGNTIEIERYFTSRYKKKGISRGDKVKPTKEEQEKVNTRQAERKLRILINANYGYGDYHLVLDYISRKGEPDRTPEQMRQDIDVFLRECRKEYRKAGLEFKYIHVMEIGKKGARHHHLVVNKIDTEILQRCWYKAYEGHNRVKVFPLDDSGNYAELANYLIKYTGTHKKGTDGALQGKRWNCSKNLVRPEPEYHIISDREYFKKEPKAIKYEKFSLQTATRNAILEMLQEVIKWDKTATKSHLYTVDTALQESKELLRLAHDLKYSAMNARHYGESCRKLKEIQKV